MDQTSKSLPFDSDISSKSGLWQSSAQNIATSYMQPHQTHPQYQPLPCTSPSSITGDRCLPPIQKLQGPSAYPEYSVNANGTSPRAFSRNSVNFAVGASGDHSPRFQRSQWLEEPRALNNFMQTAPSLPRSGLQVGEYGIPIHSQEPEYKRCRLGTEAWPQSLEVGAWEIDALAVAKSKNASRQATSQQMPLTDRPTCSWAAPGNITTESPHPDFGWEHLRKTGTWQQHTSAYPSPPHCLDDDSRRLSHTGLSQRKPSSLFSGSTRTLSGSPSANWSTVASSGRGSPPNSPTITSTTSGFDSRPGSAGPGDSTPTFEEIYNVPQVDLAPRETERTSILERFPTEIFMRIMLHCGWRQQMLLRRCNSNMYGMVRLDAIPWETKTAILLHEENFNPKNFPKKASRPQEDDGPRGQDSDATSSSDEEEPSPNKVNKGKRNAGKGPSKRRSQAKSKSSQENGDKFACYSCFKILPAYYFEGEHLENKTNRAFKSQKKPGPNNQSDKKVDTRVEYVQVISVNAGRPPDWLVKDKAEVHATDVESYVTEYMKKGVNCDDLRLHYKDITSGTHCIAPIRGVNPFFTASSTPTPPHCETYRPVYHFESSNIPAAGVDSSAYTYEICIPQNSVREDSPMGRPYTRPSTRICQPQQQQTASDASGLGPPAPAPQLKEIIALRRFCILCGAKYGVYRRECNRKVISKTKEGWWVCACPKVRQAGIGKSCPDCGKSVIY